MRARDYAIQCMKDEAEAVLGLIPQLDERFDEAVELMYHCTGKIIVTGVGKSGHIGAKIAATLSSTGTPSFFINPLDVFHGEPQNLPRKSGIVPENAGTVPNRLPENLGTVPNGLLDMNPGELPPNLVIMPHSSAFCDDYVKMCFLELKDDGFF